MSRGRQRRKKLKNAFQFALLLIFALPLYAQDPVKIDPEHNRVEYEDAKVRVIRFSLKPGEKAVMHEHPEMIVVNLTQARVRMTLLDGAAQDVVFHAGEVVHKMPLHHALENIGDTVWDAILTEFKSPGEVTLQPAPPAQPVSPHPGILQPLQKEAATPSAHTINPKEPPSSAMPTPAEPTSLNLEGAKMLFVNGTELAYIERGQGQPVVLVHDTLGDYRSWPQQLTALAKNYHVIAYSRRYHYPNHSNGKEHDYTYDQNAKDLAEFIRALNLGPVRLVGFGYGASVAGMVAAEHPELVKALVITEPAYEQMLDTTGAQHSRFAREEIYGIIRKPLTKDKPEKGVQVYVNWLGYQDWVAISAEQQFRMKQNTNALHAQTLDAAPPNFICATAKKITAPTLILSGQRRSPNSAEIAGVLSACIPNAERATVSNAGADVYIDNPAEADKLLIEFLSKH